MNGKWSVVALACAVLGALPVKTVRAENGPAGEVKDRTHTQVVVRQHPKTGKPYVSIVAEGAVPPDPFTGQRQAFARPDYRLLDPEVKSGDIPYNGPASDRTRVYIFAASLMTVGTVGGALGIAAAPAATGTAAGGAGAYAGAGAALAGATTAASYATSRKRPWDDDYQHTSESNLIREGEITVKGEGHG